MNSKKDKSPRQELVIGVLYTAVSKYIGIFVSLIISAILARLLTPNDFGVVAIATVIITFFGIFSDLGISPAIIQNQTLTKKDLSNIFSFTLYLGITISLLFFASSWLIASYYKENILIHICQLLSLNLLFASINIVPNSLLLKEKRFKFIAYRTLFFNLVGGIISVITALLGFGIYALLITPILTSLGIFLTNFHQYPQSFNPKIRANSLKQISEFSAYQFLFTFINYFSRNLDKLMIGRILGMGLLGYYDKSYRLMSLPLQNITHVITPVMHPIFAKYQTNLSQMLAYYLKIIRFLAFIGIPLSVLLYYTSSEIILIVFGDQWQGAIPVFKILSFSVGVQVILSTSGAIFQAANSTKLLFVTGLISAITNVTGLCIGIFIFKTLDAIAYAIIITFSINFIQSYWILLSKVFDKSIWLIIKELLSPLILGGILYITLYFVNIQTLDLNNFLSSGLKCISAIIIWLAYIYVMKEHFLFQLFRKDFNM